MSGKVKAFFLIVAVLLIAALFLPDVVNKLPYNNLTTVMADTGSAQWDETEDIPEDPSSDPEASGAFTILEIVPYKGLGFMGYLVDGEEPVDTSYMSTNVDTTKGNFSALGKAVSFYNSYQEAALNSSGQVNSGWYKGYTVNYQNGYFEWVGWNNGGFYKNEGDNYAYVGQGNGNYKAKLGTENTDTFNIYNPPTNRKNVIAYFVNGTPTGVELYNTTNKYKPALVNKNPGHGDYDYNTETMTFTLNRGLGDYDVIFQRSSDSDATYYMLKEGMQIVYDNSGDYSWNLSYDDVGANKGDFIKVSAGFTFDQYGGPYRWVQDNNVSATPKITKSSGDIVRAEIRGQGVTTAYQFTKGITMINNEWFKRLVLGVPADQVKNCNVDVITMTPAELNSQGNTDIIDHANLFYINDFPENHCNTLYRNYSQAGAQDVDYDSNIHNFQKIDLNWACTEAVFKRIAGVGGTRAAVMISSDIYSSTTNYNVPYSQYKDMASINNDVTTDTNSTICNVAKLYLMLMQRDIVSFYNSFMNSYANNSFKISSVNVPTSKNPTGTTGCFVRPDQISTGLSPAQFDSQYNAAKTKDIAIYWNKITFMPYEYKEDTNTLGIIDQSLKVEFPNMNMADTSNLHENVITMDNSLYIANNQLVEKSINDDSVNEGDYDSAATYEGSVNGSGTYPSSLNVSQVLNYTTKNGTGFGNSDSGTEIAGQTGTDDGVEGSNLRSYISVLNLEPTADFTESNNKIKNLDILKTFHVEIDDMTTTQFNSYIKDINTHYDIIYMGAGIGRFNLGSDGRTVFNDNTLNSNHYIFLNVGNINAGDQISTSIGKSRYYGNDLTSEKAKEIKEFLQGGYPIILEPTLYSLEPVVNSSTNVYKMINEIKNNNTLYKNVLNLADDVPMRDSSGNIITGNPEKHFRFSNGLYNGLNVIRPRIDFVSPIIDESSELQYFYPNNGDLAIEFRLKYWGYCPSTYIYNAYLYLDINGDGLFDSVDERISIEDNTGQRRWEGITEDTDWKHSCTLDLKQADLNLSGGVYQWKLQVVRKDNPEIRSEVTGYAAYSRKQDIKVLQIIDNPKSGISDFSLESEVNNAGSLIREYFGYNGTPLQDYNITFDTKTVSEFEAMYGTAHPYNSSNRAETDQLYPYHLLILDNQTDHISNLYGALQNIKDELADNLGVIFTKGAVDFNYQSDYLNAASVLFTDGYTYNQINRRANSGHLYIYSGFTNLNKDSTFSTTYLTGSNKGSVSEYPYHIGDTLDIAGNSYSSNVVLDYDSSSTSGTPLVGWYCLSDDKNPVSNSSVADSSAYMGMYSSSPNDVNNNYYLFNRGNSYYSGIVLKNAEDQGKTKEIQLFVNTVIAAFKNCGRRVITPPVISILQPAPDAATGVIQLAYTDIGAETELPVIFEITGSSSPMEVTISWDDPEGAAGNWNQTVYRVSGTDVLADTADLSHMDNGRYAVKIPVDDLNGTHVLTIHAENDDGKITELLTTIKYTPLPITVAITNGDLIKSNGKQYLYVDTDFTSDFGDTSDPGHPNDDIRIEFTIENAGGNTSVSITDSAGTAVDIRDGLIYDASGNTYQVNVKEIPDGSEYSYYFYIPASVLDGFGSRDIIITAAVDADHSGSSTVTLLRRSLFPLD